ncbi:MAG: hypothetical protein IJ530_10040 [Treponema sp.]|uniref:hypothetical protein n=1 Tax=Treponema sp. TaxID=166 RepID=UPI0025D7BDB5|nr:hypothetical protein [Treponema sp.]MBQ8680088.1 hypothetical protein [Treponema sp.]
MKKKHKFIIFATVLLLCGINFSEWWIHAHDYYGILGNKIGTAYIVKGLLPRREKLASGGVAVRLPYGHARVGQKQGMGLSLFLLDSIDDEMNAEYQFFDQFGSSTLWIDKADGSMIFVDRKRFSFIEYIVLNKRPLEEKQ